MTKGSELSIEGRLNADSYLDSNGEKKYNLAVTLEEFHLLGDKKENIS